MAKPRKKIPKELPPEPTPWLSYILYAVGGAAFLVGQIYFFQGQIEKALPLSIFGVVSGFCGRLLPRDLVALCFQAVRASPAVIRIWLKSHKTAPPAVRARGKKVVAKAQVDQVVFSRIWLLAPGLFFAALSQLFLIRGQVPLAVISIAGLALFLAVFLQDTQMPLVIPHPVQNLKIAILMAAGLGVQIWGGTVLWEYRNVMFGFVLTSLASVFMLLLLWKYPLRFIQGPDDRAQDLQGTKPLHFFTSKVWNRKALLLGTAAFTAYLAKFIFAATSLNLSVTLAFIAIFLLIASFPWLPHGLASWQLIPKSLRSIMALALAGFAFYAGHQGQSAIERGHINTGLWWFLAGGILLILAVQDDPSTSLRKSPSTDPKAASKENPKHFWPTALEILALAVLVGVGFAFRVWRVGEFPYGAEGDEAGGGLWALDALHGRVENPFVSANVALHFFTLTGWVFKYFGVSITTLRIHAVIFGTLSLITTYFFLRLFWGRWIAYLTTALMSFAYWHLHFSRFGHYVIEQVCCQMAAFFFFFLGVKRKSFIPFIIGGVFFGLAIMPGVASRLLPFQGIALLIYLFASRRDILRTHANGLLAFVLAAWMVTSPAMIYWFRTLPMSTRRSAEVSIFNRAEPNAPVSRVAGFVQNGKISLLMFNHRGDTRSRDNPVAPERILERWTAALFALALVYALYNFRQPVFFFLLMCFFINLAASVFSVEAPQTHRSAGNIPIVFAIIAPLLYSIHKAFLGLGRGTGSILSALIFIPMMGFLSFRSAHTYFVRFSHQSFDITASYVALEARKKSGQNYKANFWATGFASGHLPVLLFKGETPIRNFFTLGHFLPISEPLDTGYLLMLCDDFQAALPYLTSLYPEAKISSIPNKLRGGNLAMVVDLPPEVRAKAHGLRAEIRTSNGISIVDNADLSYPFDENDEALQITWKGSIRLPSFGRYQFLASSQGDSQIYVDERIVFSKTSGKIEARSHDLAMGMHKIRVIHEPSGSNDPFQVTWKGEMIPGSGVFHLRRPLNSKIPVGNLFMLDKPMGLYGEYFGRGDWSGRPVFHQVEPTLLNRWLDPPIVGTSSARWKAKLRIQKAGVYHFGSHSGGYCEIYVDKKLVHRNGRSLVPVFRPPQPIPFINLDVGLHDLEVKFATKGSPRMDLMWTPPGAQETILLPEFMTPVYPLL